METGAEQRSGRYHVSFCYIRVEETGVTVQIMGEISYTGNPVDE